MIQLKSIERSYKTGAGGTWVLRRVSLDSDLLTLAVVTVPVAAVAPASALLPARRAAKTDPIVALGYE
jgi:ABC-type lipoprotein release transport system permease subunit